MIRRSARTCSRLAPVFVLLAAFERPARAQDAPEPIHLDYQASPGCPDEAAFLNRVRSRTGRARFVGPAARARRFSVTIDAGASGATGRVVVVETDGVEHTRHLDAGTCEDVADALGLIVALAIDPRASSAPSPPPPEPAAAGEPHPPGDSALPSPSATPAPAPSPLPAPTSLSPPPPPTSAMPPPPRPAPAPSSVPPSRPAPSFFVGAGFGVTSGVAPDALPSQALFAGRENGRRSMLLRATFLRTASGAVGASSAPGGRRSVHLDRWTARRC